ncbi:glycosyltransferase [Sphingomonas desiccabilis]|uniref:Glycosyltransferase n=1 Tax=Sphingomonas desiccabilis TaxID=429134 RepID=A0A4Q2IPG7_9SPHN|nr:glycosyltransferase [Sphingomonas desiccabilis]MBB3911833.1 cellulose synthase/poly-beta-1,6-N-acetylglucosamine synthase-like glycosyltransferase [Sphingomonas desiccabilis]RXZ31452.1 glycosyltransferase [Sphingomonas desiccabilis]
MIALALLAASVGAGLLALFPYTLYPLALRLAPRRPLRMRARRAPTATLVFCAYNESASIPAKLANLRAIREVWPAMRFRCFVDQSTDDTLALLRAASDIVDVDTAGARVGKATGMRRLVAACDTDVVIFTDANVMLEPLCVPRLLAYFSDSEVGGVCGTLHYTNPDASDATIASSAYWRLEEKIKARESACGSTMGADGSIFATRRHLYPQVPPNLLDDFIVSMTVVFGGMRLVSAPDVHAYETAVVEGADEFRRRRRIACRAYMTHNHLRPRVLSMSPFDIYKYVSHKLIRWYGIWLAMASMIFAGLAAIAFLGIWIGVPLVAAATVVFAICARPPFAAVRKLREAALQFWATGLGMADAWRGRQYQTWSTPASRAQVDLASAPGIEPPAPLRTSAGGAG